MSNQMKPDYTPPEGCEIDTLVGENLEGVERRIRIREIRESVRSGLSTMKLLKEESLLR